MSYCHSNEELQKRRHPTRHKTAPARGGDQRATVAQHEDDAHDTRRGGTLRRPNRSPAGGGTGGAGPDAASRLLLKKLSQIGLVY
jgi:hypothetical protein